MVSQLEAQISKLVEQLGNESQFHQKALQRAQKAENKLETLQGQLTHLEEELVSGGVLRDDLNFEKQKVITWGLAHGWKHLLQYKILCKYFEFYSTLVSWWTSESWVNFREQWILFWGFFLFLELPWSKLIHLNSTGIYWISIIYETLMVWG